MDKRPCHGENGDSVALGSDEQLLKRCLRMTPPKADQDPPRRVEDAPAQSDLGGNPVCRHVFPICCDDRTDARDRHGQTKTPWPPPTNPAPALASERGCTRSALSITLCQPAVGPDHGTYRYAAVIALRQHRGNRPASTDKQRLPGTSGHPDRAREEVLLARAHGNDFREFADRYRKMAPHIALRAHGVGLRRCHDGGKASGCRCLERDDI